MYNQQRLMGNFGGFMFSWFLSSIFVTIKPTLCNLKAVACSDEPDENYHQTQMQFSECVGTFFWFYKPVISTTLNRITFSRSRQLLKTHRALATHQAAARS